VKKKKKTMGLAAASCPLPNKQKREKELRCSSSPMLIPRTVSTSTDTHPPAQHALYLGRVSLKKKGRADRLPQPVSRPAK
jgi:hypothetical protein